MNDDGEGNIPVGYGSLGNVSLRIYLDMLSDEDELDYRSELAENDGDVYEEFVLWEEMIG